MLRWTGEHWDLKDLGSRNGTFLDGNRIKSGEEHEVQKGATISFGKPEQRPPL
jgi:pSer/pThr/pTyr-binding forkhead associated (FHA) protein